VDREVHVGDGAAAGRLGAGAGGEEEGEGEKDKAAHHWAII